jgi:hypothetical protein
LQRIFTLTTPGYSAIFNIQQGDLVRRSLWTFVLLLLTGIVGAAAVPPTDLPETSYNESDTPVNQAPPVVQGIRFVRPVQVVKRVPQSVIQARHIAQLPVEDLGLLPPSTRHQPSSIQDLLCTLLI